MNLRTWAKTAKLYGKLNFLWDLYGFVLSSTFWWNKIQPKRLTSMTTIAPSNLSTQNLSKANMLQPLFFFDHDRRKNDPLGTSRCTKAQQFLWFHLQGQLLHSATAWFFGVLDGPTDVAVPALEAQLDRRKTKQDETSCPSYHYYVTIPWGNQTWLGNAQLYAQSKWGLRKHHRT